MAGDANELIPGKKSAGSEYDQVRRLALFPDPTRADTRDLLLKQMQPLYKAVEPPKQVLRNSYGKPIKGVDGKKKIVQGWPCAGGCGTIMNCFGQTGPEKCSACKKKQQEYKTAQEAVRQSGRRKTRRFKFRRAQ